MLWRLEISWVQQGMFLGVNSSHVIDARQNFIALLEIKIFSIFSTLHYGCIRRRRYIRDPQSKVCPDKPTHTG